MRARGHRMRKRVAAWLAALAVIGGGLVAATPATAAVVDVSMSVGDLPVDVVVSADDSTAYVSSFNAGTVSRIDLALGSMTAVIAVGNGAHRLLISPDGTRLYVFNEVSSYVTLVDLATFAVTSTVPMAISPAAGVFSPDGSTLYIAGLTGVAAVDPDTLSGATAPIGQGFDIAISPDGTRLYATMYNYITILDAATLDFIDGVTVTNGLNMELSPDGELFYLSTSDMTQVTVVATSPPISPRAIEVFGIPNRMTLSPDGRYLAVASDGAVRVFDTVSGDQLDEVAAGEPMSLRFFDGAAGLIFTDQLTDTLVILEIDAAPAFTTTSLPAGSVGAPYAATIGATGRPAPTFALASGSLPPGVTLAANGALSGTPTAAGTYSFTVSAANTAYGTAESTTRAFTITVATAPAGPVEPAAELPPTGADVGGAALVAALLLALGAGALAAARRRTRAA